MSCGPSCPPGTDIIDSACHITNGTLCDGYVLCGGDYINGNGTNGTNQNGTNGTNQNITLGSCVWKEIPKQLPNRNSLRIK